MLFIDYVILAVGSHLPHRYGGMRTMTRPVRGGLAHWQERRAKELKWRSVTVIRTGLSGLIDAERFWASALLSCRLGSAS